VGLVRGDTDWRAATVVRGTPSGALYVVARDPDRLIPTTDLASARLLAAGVDPERADAAAGRAPADPTPVRDDALAAAPRTMPAGLAGGPSTLPDTRTAPVPDVWAVCDGESPQRPGVVPAAVLGGYPALGRPLGPDEAVLLRGGDGATWLVAEGRRAAVDPAQGAVVRALGIAGAPARPAGPALLGTLPVGAPLVPPVIPGAGAVPSDPATRTLGLPVGAVARAGADRFLVVLDRGVQEVPDVVAQLVRFAAPVAGAGPEITDVGAAALGRVPRALGVDLAAYPRAFPRALGVAEAPVVCSAPDPAAARGSAVTVADALPSPVLPTPGPAGQTAVDAVRVAGAGAYVVPVGPGEPVDPARGVVVDPVGRLFPVAGERAAAALGLGTPRPAPRSVVGLLPRGPTLDLDAARTLR
ncbi:type VII secretion protein EccB, partial [Actinomycetospora atypica]